MTLDYDAIIIGTGQAGPPLAARLSAAGQKVAVIERQSFGGTCVNTGCIPTKTMVASAYAANLARRGAEYGVVPTGPVTVDMARVKARKDGVVGKSTHGVETWVRTLEHGTVHLGHARFEGPDTVRVNDTLLRAGKIFINVGGRAAAPPMPGLEQVDYLTNAGMMRMGTLPRHLLVVGGSYIGLEFGQMFRRFGSEVTIVQRGPRLIEREDPDVSDAVRDILAAEGVGLRLDAECIALEQRGAEVVVKMDCARGAPEIVGSHVLLAGGRTAAQYRRPWPRPRRGRRGCARLYPGRRTVAHQCARHLGHGRLQRPRRLYPYRLQRFRDRRRQPAGRGIRRAAPHGRRPHPRLCALHRPTAGARGHERGRGAPVRAQCAGRHAADDAGGPRSGKRRDARLHEDPGGCRQPRDPWRGGPRRGRRRGDPLHPGRDVCLCAVHGDPARHAYPPHGVRADPDHAGRAASAGAGRPGGSVTGPRSQR
ncbi:mercuric reductase [Cupriavidus basilensis OR16]|uniref:Mercuric reductase n=1 Tax=Cupriavidus basilensis OR16 TaxID=1127483 RepID=H1SE74_9BURK|nr:mercuric reductase [Cupriavidus basilensis OR16]